MSDLAKQAEAVLRLAWLSPSAASLAVLGRLPTATTWPAMRRDPGAVLLVVRHSEVAWAGRSSSAPPPSFHATAFEQAALIEDALRLLEQPDGFVDWNQANVQPVYDACLTFARLARRLAERTGQCDPEAAWTCGLLAPLGWLAMCAVNPEAVSACLADPALRVDAAETQRRHWGIDQAAIARGWRGAGTYPPGPPPPRNTFTYPVHWHRISGPIPSCFRSLAWLSTRRASRAWTWDCAAELSTQRIEPPC